jgi:ACT domain-containing protein
MPRRFVTVEDVRRAGGAEIVIDDTTVVTPQAQEAAALAGVTIRNAHGGAYTPPPPDRGPDAERASHHLPHMPEPLDEMHGATGVVVTAVGRNRPGILAQITATIAETGASVEHISQRTIEDYFHLVLTVRLSAPGAFAELKGELDCLGGEDDYVVRVMHERVFRFMHRI